MGWALELWLPQPLPLPLMQVSSSGQAADIVYWAEELGHGTVQGQLVAGGRTTDNGAHHGETLN